MTLMGNLHAWGHFGSLGLGIGCFVPGELCSALLFGSTMVLEGVV